MEEKTDLEKEIEGVVRVYRSSFGSTWWEIFEKTVKVELPCIALDALDKPEAFVDKLKNPIDRALAR